MSRIYTSILTKLMLLLALILSITLLPSLASAQSGDCEALFLSEYIDGSGNDKAIEIFNPTGDEIDMKDYSIGIYLDGYDNPR